MKRQTAVSIAAAAAALCAAGGASAQMAGASATGAYADIDVTRNSGPTNGDIDSAFGNQGIAGTSSSVDNDKTRWGLNLGYRFHPNWAAELGYREFGKFAYSTNAPGGTINGAYKTNAWSLSGLYLYPIPSSGFSLYGKLGLARTDTSLSVDSQSPGLTASGASGNRTGWLAGLGGTYDFARNWYARAGWDHYDRVGDSNTGRTDIDSFSLGIGLRF